VDFVNERVKLFGICSERNAVEKDSQVNLNSDFYNL